MPDANVWEQLGLSHVKVLVLQLGHIVLCCGQQQVLQIGRAAAEPILERLQVTFAASE